MLQIAKVNNKDKDLPVKNMVFKDELMIFIYKCNRKVILLVSYIIIGTVLCIFFSIKISTEDIGKNSDNEWGILVLWCIIKASFQFLMGMYTIYSIDMYPTSVNGIGNGLIKSCGLLEILYAPNFNFFTIVNTDFKSFTWCFAELFIVCIIQYYAIEKQSPRKKRVNLETVPENDGVVQNYPDFNNSQNSEIQNLFNTNDKSEKTLNESF